MIYKIVWIILFAVSVISLAVLIFIKWKYGYWKRKQVPFLPPRMLIGNMKNPLTSDIPTANEYQFFYNRIKFENLKHAGIYSLFKPVYIPVDLEYIKNILTKDFRKFVDRGRYYNEKDDPISAHLFHLGGTKWKNLRTTFTPTFSIAKLKSMFDSLLECQNLLETAVSRYCISEVPVETKHFARMFTIDIIGLCVFGVQFNSLDGSNSQFVSLTNKFIRGDFFEYIRLIFVFSFPKLARFLKMRRYDKNATKYFTEFITGLVNEREIKNIRRNDFLQLLIDLKNVESVAETNELDKQPITIDQLIAQAMVFFVAGHETSATTIALALFELAYNPQIQDKLRNEIILAIKKADGKLTYENVGELNYMQQVINETLRKYPPLTILNRESIESYAVPDTDVVLEKGTSVVISLLGLHYNSEYFPNPNRFDPDRFSAENIANIKPYSYLPFGEGPRICIGLRFGLLMVKVALCGILKEYEVSINARTKIPLEFEKSPVINIRGGIWLNVNKIS